MLHVYIKKKIIKFKNIKCKQKQKVLIYIFLYRISKFNYLLKYKKGN